MILSPDGSMLVTFSNSGTIGIWDVEDFTLVQSLRDSNVVFIHVMVTIFIRKRILMNFIPAVSV